MSAKALGNIKQLNKLLIIGMDDMTNKYHPFFLYLQA